MVNAPCYPPRLKFKLSTKLRELQSCHLLLRPPLLQMPVRIRPLSPILTGWSNSKTEALRSHSDETVVDMMSSHLHKRNVRRPS